MWTFVKKLNISKLQTINLEREIKLSADAVWLTIGKKFGDISNYHPDIYSSTYIYGHFAGGEGVQRVCYFNKEKTKYAQEVQLDFKPEDYSFNVQTLLFNGIAMNAENTYVKYKIEAINSNSCRLIIEMNYQSTLAFLGRLTKSSVKASLELHAKAIEKYSQVILQSENSDEINIESATNFPL